MPDHIPGPDDPPPFHLVSGVSGKHIGPFSTYADALLARHIANPEFQSALILGKDDFKEHLDFNVRVGRKT